MAKLKKTIAAECIFPHLNEPDEYEGTEQYKVTLRLPLNEEWTQQFIEHLEEIRDSYWEENAEKEVPKAAKRKKFQPADVYEEETDEDEEGNEEATGYGLFRFKMNASYKRKGKVVEMQPTIVDAKKKKLPKNVRVGMGSTIKVGFTERAYIMAATEKYGVSLRLSAVQVLDLNESGGGGASVFDEEEDGFDSSGYESDDDDSSDDDQTEDNTDVDDDDMF